MPSIEEIEDALTLKDKHWATQQLKNGLAVAVTVGRLSHILVKFKLIAGCLHSMTSKEKEWHRLPHLTLIYWTETTHPDNRYEIADE